MTGGAHDDRRAAVALALVVLALVASHVLGLFAPNTWINRDGRFYTNVNVTIVEDLSFEQSDFAASWYNGELGWNRDLPGSFSNIALGRNGEHWPMHPWILPVLSTPLFFALGLVGTLVFNVLMFGLIAAGSYRFARQYASAPAAAMGAAVFLLGTAVHEYAYDYHVDVLLLALFSMALAALATRRGVWLGVLVGCTLVIKPTSILLVPALLAFLWERRDLATLKRAVLGGAAVLGAVALVNTYMFGRPWRFGYMRVLTVEDGVKVLASSGEAFITPLDEGMARTWSGYWGLRHRHTLLALALPGLLVMLLRRPRYAFAAVLTAVAAFLVFSKYHFEGDRFLWPALSLLVPALAGSFDLAERAMTRLSERVRRLPASAALPAVAGMLCVLAVAATFFFDPPPVERLPESAYVLGATAAGDGTLDLREVLGDDYLDRTAVEDSLVARSRFGHWLARTSPPALLVAAPFTAAFGKGGLVLLHLLALGVAAGAAVALARRTAHPVAAVACVVGPALLPMVRDQVVAGGPPLLAAGLALPALVLATRGRWAAAGALGAASAWMLDAPWLAGAAVLLVALRDGRPALVRAAIGAGAVLLAWGAGHLVLIGRPFASPEDFVLGFGQETFAVDAPPLLDHLAATLGSGAGRTLALLLALAPFGVAAARDRDLAILLGVPLLSLFLPGVLPAHGDPRTVLLVLALALPLAPLATALSRAGVHAAETASRRRKLAALGVALGLLALTGAGSWVARATEPLRFETARAVREGEVLLADRIPCDFLPWEHLTWECSHFDRGHFNQVGLALPEGVEVGGEPADLLLLPTGGRREPRSITWHDVEATARLRLRWAVPDRAPGGVRLEVKLDGETVETVETPVQADGEIHEVDIDTSPFAGRTVDLTLRAEPLTRPAAGIAVGGGFVHGS